MPRVAFEPELDAWRPHARALLAAEVPPDAIDWQPRGERNQLSLLGDAERPPTDTTTPPARPVAVPRSFADRSRLVARHRDPDRWSLLYRLLWRLGHGEPHVMRVPVDPDVGRFEAMAKAVRRDAHKMKAFVRFRRIVGDDGEPWFIAWHRPDHRIVPLVAPFFAERFNDQRWTILTPDASVSWDLRTLRFDDGVPREAAPAADVLEDLWRTYYASIFNPARVKVKAMKAEMPVRHWATLPEATLIPALLRDAPARVRTMVERAPRPPVHTLLPTTPTIDALAEALPRCRACALCENGTEPVAGEGPADATIVIVGEQPGDHEAHLGRPFVGPAGQILDRVLGEVGLDRDRLYLTNTVKHFKHERRGVKRIHRTPGLTEVSSCLPWVRAELAVVQPEILVCLGATAARALVGGEVRLRRDRGQPRATAHAPWTVVTYHPAALLRMPDPNERRRAEQALRDDLALVAAQARTLDAADR